MNVPEFQATVKEYAKKHTRTMPWRDNTDPYWVLVSEMMLQQTQVSRVKPKFESFIEHFPSIQHLADAELAAVLASWSGLGYNRRAKFLWQAAKEVVNTFNGDIPQTRQDLMSLPGVGENTAGAILAYSFNQPAVFIETNIRTVFIYHFFQDQTSIADKEVKKLVERTMDKEHPRQWYWALMDYGSHLKKNGVGNIRYSSHYKKQSPLKGSIREMRGRIIKILATQPSLSKAKLAQLAKADNRFDIALQALLDEHLIHKKGNIYSL